jgi:ArsR family transcriptional regulator
MKIYANVRDKRKPAMTEEKLIDLAELFKIFGDSTRIRILYTLLRARAAGELCVSDLAKALEMTQSAISHQLRILKSNKLVRSRREGKTIFYALSDSHVESILHQGMEHILE